MNLTFFTLDCTALKLFELQFLNQLFSSVMNWDSNSFTVVKIKFSDGDEILGIQAPTDLEEKDILTAVATVEGIVRSMTVEEIIKTYID